MKGILTLIALTALPAICRCFQTECNATLPWNVPMENHPAIPPERFEELLRCPEELHGCSESRVNCTEDLFAVTCSCAVNCELYGDCCWDAGASLSSSTASACISRNVDKYSKREFYVVSGCDSKWPDDEVRSSCENATALKDAFYLIPVTSEREVTYFNAFCALCNYDLDNTSMFWNASGNSGRNFQVSPPLYALENSDVFFWPCDADLVEVQSCPEGADPETKRKCLTYFAPGVVYVLYRTSRTFSSRCTLCLSGTLFCSHLLFLLGNSPDVSKPVCVGFAVVLHYGFLSTFFWTSVLSFDIWKNVAAVRLTSSRHGGFLLYALVAWGGPLIVIALCLVLNWTAPDFVLSPQYGRFVCWIGSLWSQLAFFLMPMVILLILDIGLYVHIVVVIRNTAKRAAAFDFKGGGNKSHMALFVKLAFIMGTTWLLAFVGAFVKVLALDIIVIVLIGLQGVYLFFGFKDYEHLLPKRFKRKQRVVSTGASTAHTELSSSGKDHSSREDIHRSPAARSSEKLN
ncbi:hypothetical protein HPB50_002805 [Hyalomma asiaticum]|uniref:Uncharacterized protein n=1 Tax=Hyalomma asiaticum TaxID=266040 RepID=A0ACB7S353_HYAAI|nr:hypothetical protein HPB50_002805 [Hyalomma asiaticum]